MEKIRKIFVLFVLTFIVFIGSPTLTSAKEQTPSHNSLTSFSKIINDNKSKYSKYIILDNIGWSTGEYGIFLILYNGSIDIKTNGDNITFSQPNFLVSRITDNSSGSISWTYEYEGTSYHLGSFVDYDVRYSNGVFKLDDKSFHLAPLDKTISEGAEQVTLTTRRVAVVVLTIVASSILLYRVLVILVKKLRHFLV